MTKGRQRLQKFLLVCVSVMVSLIVFPLLYEFVLYLASDEKPEYTKFRYVRLKEFEPNAVYYLTPNLQQLKNSDSLENRTYRVAIDDNGFISPSKVHEVADTTIIFLGGSTTECAYMAEDARFPYLAGRLLEKGRGKINSYNSGVSGNHSVHSLDILLNKCIGMKPDYVVLMHNINDLQVLLLESGYWNQNPTRSLVVSTDTGLKEHLKDIVKSIIPRVYQRLFLIKTNINISRRHKQGDEFARVRGTQVAVDEQGILASFRSSLETFVAMCKYHHIKPVLMTQANRLTSSLPADLVDQWSFTRDFDVSYEDYIRVYHEMNEEIRRVAAEQDVLLVDLAEEIPQDKAHMYDWVHLTEKGSRLAAECIAEAMGPALDTAESGEHE